MKSENSYSYILIGILLRLLRNLSSSDQVSFVKSSIKQLKESLNSVEFTITCSNFTTSFFVEMENRINGVDDSIEVGKTLAEEIKNEMWILERHVLSEGTTKKVHIMPQRRYNSNYLLNEQEKLFKKGVFEKLNELAQSDIKSSCRCLLFGEATASAFHILRATEGVLKQYYKHHIRQKQLTKPMWGPMLIKLKAKTRNKPSETLLDSLDLIRDSYRNPTQHPNATYEIDSVQDLIGLCTDVIGKMANEL